MKQKYLLAGTVCALVVTMAGCSGNTTRTEQSQMISMDAAQTAALKQANIEAENTAISSTTIDEVAGVTCYKVEFTSGDYTYAYSINAENGEVLEASCRDKNAAPADSTQPDTTASGATTTPAQTTPSTNTNTSTGAVDEAKAQELALARVSGAAASDIYEWKLDYDDGRPEYEGKIIYGGTEYDFTIDATSGTVTEWDAESLNR